MIIPMNMPIDDYWKDGHIDCKDYAVRNSIIIERLGYESRWLVTKNHVVVYFERNGNIYVFSNDKLYVTGIRK